MGDVGAGLGAWLADHGVPDTTVEVEQRATGGLSQETWFVRLRTPDGDQPAVLRLPTRASGGRAIRTQVTALQSVADGAVPAPRLRWWDLDDGFDGRPFLVMARAEGEVPTGWHQLPRPRRDELASRAIDVLADLHATPLADTPMAGRPPHPLMTLDGLASLLGRFEVVPLPIRRALDWLVARRPVDHEPPVLVHGDYRMGNLAVDRQVITAVLDWELAAPGQREVDLVWCFLPVFEPAGVDEAALLDRYAERTGRDLDPDVVRWHRVQALVRLAYYSLSATRAFDSGRSDDLRLAVLRLRLPTTLQRLSAAMAGEDATA